jgi:hypothetical protein
MLTTTRLRAVAAACVLSSAWLACRETTQEPPTAVEAANTETAAPAEAAPDKPPEKTAETAAEVRPAVAKPAPVELWAAAPLDTTVKSIAQILEPGSRVGVYVGLPAGWRNDDPSYLLFFPRKNIAPPAAAPSARALAMALNEPGLAEVNRERLLKRGIEPTGLRDAVWETWVEQTVGLSKLRATVVRGSGRSIAAQEGDRAALAAIIDVPGAPALGFVGSWPRSEPAGEAEIGEMLRRLETCKVEVGRGCVEESARKL